MADRQIHGVGFAINNEILRQLAELPVGINERLMTLRLGIHINRLVTVISAYASTRGRHKKIT